MYHIERLEGFRSEKAWETVDVKKLNYYKSMIS